MARLGRACWKLHGRRLTDLERMVVSKRATLVRNTSPRYNTGIKNGELNRNKKVVLVIHEHIFIDLRNPRFYCLHG